MSSLLTPFTFNLIVSGRVGGREPDLALLSFISKILTNRGMWILMVTSHCCFSHLWRGNKQNSLGDCEARWWCSPSFSNSIVPSSFPDPSFPILLKCRFGFRASRLGEWGKAEIDASFSSKGVTDPFHPPLYFGAVLIPWITWGSLNTMDSQATHQTDWIRVTGAEARQVFREKKSYWSDLVINLSPLFFFWGGRRGIMTALKTSLLESDWDV